jgi:hypothetical protein
VSNELKAKEIPTYGVIEKTANMKYHVAIQVEGSLT